MGLSHPTSALICSWLTIVPVSKPGRREDRTTHVYQFRFRTGNHGNRTRSVHGPAHSMLLMVLIFYFLVIRPQSQRAAQHREMVEKVRRGDTVVTSGGMIGKVTKVSEGSDEIEVELSDALRVRILKSTLMDVRAKGEPVKETA